MGKETDRAHVEDGVRLYILEALAQGGSRTTQELTKAVRARLKLSPADLETAAKRHNEQKIDQIIANALQEKRTLCRDGLIERDDIGVFRIAPKGVEFLKQHNDSVAAAVALFGELYPDVD